MKYLIIGNGIAGISASEAIRELDHDAELVMVGNETFLPYSRPMISHVLEGSQPHDKLPIRSKSFYASLNITPILGDRVETVDVKNCCAQLKNGAQFSYDRLLIASGADPRPLTAEGMDLGNIFYMRTEADVRKQLAAIPEAQHAVVIGGGLVGFKAAYGLLKRGLTVTMLITSGYPLSRQVDRVAGKMILSVLTGKGLRVETGISVTGFEGSGVVAAAVTDTGKRIACELVIIGKGVLPAHGFIPKDHIKTDLGIVVNQHMETTVPGIYAAGDVAESIDIARQCPWVNAIWPEAAIQGRIAGLNMAGRAVAFAGSLSRNVMRVYDLDALSTP